MTRPKTIAVVGLGLLGRGIATCLLGHGLRVVGMDRSADSRSRAREQIASGLDEMIRYADFDRGLLDQWQDHYDDTDSLTDCRDCDFVIESITEEVEAKRTVFAELEQVIDPESPIASNTSAIPVSLLQQALVHPERLVGMHWAEPAHGTRFLEIVRGPLTDQRTVERTLALARQCGKEPSVLQRDIPGFIVNRLGYAMYREAAYLVEQGVADIETIDRSFRNACGLWATCCGPFQWIDLTGGPALYAKAMAQVLPTLSNTTEVPPLFAELAAKGAQGVTNGQGFYDWTESEAKQAESLYRRHAWKVYQLMNEYFSTVTPPNDPADPEPSSP